MRWRLLAILMTAICSCQRTGGPSRRATRTETISGQGYLAIARATPFAEKAGVDVAALHVTVTREDDRVTVSFSRPDRSDWVYGSSASDPAFDVTLSAADLHVISAHRAK